MKVDNSYFFVAGAIGFLSGFFAWFFWLLLTVSAWLHYQLGFGYANYMSGIFFQVGIFHTVFRILLAISLALGSFGCFALKRKYGSILALGCGILCLVLSTVLVSSQFLPRTRLWYSYYNPIVLLNVGLIALGATWLSNQKALPKPKRAFWIGLIFFIISVGSLTPSLLPVILYWGYEFWLLLLGWLYAINCIATSWLMLQIRGYPDQPIPESPATSSTPPQPS